MGVVGGSALSLVEHRYGQGSEGVPDQRFRTIGACGQASGTTGFVTVL